MSRKVKFFYLHNCPFCKMAANHIRSLTEEHPELRDVEIEMTEESEHPEIAERYDYHYVPTFYIGSRKVHEGSVTRERMEAILREALK